jgi:hypothetical protein
LAVTLSQWYSMTCSYNRVDLVTAYAEGKLSFGKVL